ncbi:MAG TPA: hypothetical protein VFQ11_00525 [Nocardioidaceae bacterium]|nr:hypothetical protein [Nocardioidaceae bacterium]
MSEPTGRPSDRPDARAEAEHRRRRAAVFGQCIPSDEATDPADLADLAGSGIAAGSGDPAGSDAAADEWLRSQVPPHHG